MNARGAFVHRKLVERSLSNANTQLTCLQITQPRSTNLTAIARGFARALRARLRLQRSDRRNNEPRERKKDLGQLPDVMRKQSKHLKQCGTAALSVDVLLWLLCLCAS